MSDSADVSDYAWMTNGKNDPPVPGPDPASPLSPAWFDSLLRDKTSEYLSEALEAVMGRLKSRPGDKFFTALRFACERDAEIARITLDAGSEHWAVRKDGTIISVFPDLALPINEHPDLQHLSEDIFVPSRALADELPKWIRRRAGR